MASFKLDNAHRETLTVVDDTDFETVHKLQYNSAALAILAVLFDKGPAVNDKGRATGVLEDRIEEFSTDSQLVEPSAGTAIRPGRTTSSWFASR